MGGDIYYHMIVIVVKLAVVCRLLGSSSANIFVCRPLAQRLLIMLMHDHHHHHGHDDDNDRDHNHEHDDDFDHASAHM